MRDFADFHQQRQRPSHVTQQLLWEEYRQANPDSYRYFRFCELYQRWRRSIGRGTIIPIYDRSGGGIGA